MRAWHRRVRGADRRSSQPPPLGCRQHEVPRRSAPRALAYAGGPYPPRSGVSLGNPAPKRPLQRSRLFDGGPLTTVTCSTATARSDTDVLWAHRRRRNRRCGAVRAVGEPSSRTRVNVHVAHGQEDCSRSLRCPLSLSLRLIASGRGVHRRREPDVVTKPDSSCPGYGRFWVSTTARLQRCQAAFQVVSHGVDDAGRVEHVERSWQSQQVAASSSMSAPAGQIFVHAPPSGDHPGTS
jgi:hypothetical protein